MEEAINLWVSGVSTCIIVIAGTILNCVSIRIIWKKYQRTNIFYQMLIHLLCIDICVLVTWANLSLVIAFQLENEIIIHMVPYFSYPSTQIAITASTFMTVAIAHERYLAIRDPLKYSADMKTPNVQRNRLRRYQVLVLLVSVVINFPHFLDLEVKYVNLSKDMNSTNTNSNSTYLSYGNKSYTSNFDKNCDIDPKNTFNKSEVSLTPIITANALGRHPYYLNYYRNFARLIVSGIIPLVSLIWLNTSIYKATKRNNNRRKRFTSFRERTTPRIDSAYGSSIRTGTSAVAKVKRKDEENLSMVFVVIVIAFILCHSLRFILNCYDGIFGRLGATTGSRIAGYFSNFLVILNSSINTIIYCIMNAKFRTHFWNAIKNTFSSDKQPVQKINNYHQNPDTDNIGDVCLFDEQRCG